jgi:hypothetical protein
MNTMSKLSRLILLCAAWAAMQASAAVVDEAPIGEAVERHLPGDEPFMKWVQDPEDVETEHGDTIELRETLEDALETVKLSGLVPPIHFESGVAQIPDTTVESLNKILERMDDRWRRFTVTMPACRVNARGRLPSICRPRWRCPPKPSLTNGPATRSLSDRMRPKKGAP